MPLLVFLLPWTLSPVAEPHPHEACGPLLPPSGCMQNFTRQEVLDYFDNTWTMTEILFASLQVRCLCDPAQFVGRTHCRSLQSLPSLATSKAMAARGLSLVLPHTPRRSCTLSGPRCLHIQLHYWSPELPPKLPSFPCLGSRCLPPPALPPAAPPQDLLLRAPGGGVCEQVPRGRPAG